jgi:hypothetical protein
VAEQGLLDHSAGLATADQLDFWKSLIDAIDNAAPVSDGDGDGRNGLGEDPIDPQGDPRFDGESCGR